jgi:hypothetical protein
MPSSGQRRKRPGPLTATASYTGQAHRPAGQCSGIGPGISAQLPAQLRILPATVVSMANGPHPTPDRPTTDVY